MASYKANSASYFAKFTHAAYALIPKDKAHANPNFPGQQIKEVDPWPEKDIFGLKSHPDFFANVRLFTSLQAADSWRTSAVASEKAEHDAFIKDAAFVWMMEIAPLTI